MRSFVAPSVLLAVLLLVTPLAHATPQAHAQGKTFTPPFSSIDEVTAKAKSFEGTPDSGIAAGNPITRILFHANHRNGGKPYWEVHWAHPFTKNAAPTPDGHRPSSSLCLFKEGSFVPCPVHPKRMKAKAAGASSAPTDTGAKKHHSLF